ncbi:MAG: flagellar basal body-associated FliL family protein [Nitrospinae bacterium]|nr:flagellar basal body-associated FliL family protein [Nitrospinota bacterium]
MAVENMPEEAPERLNEEAPKPKKAASKVAMLAMIGGLVLVLVGVGGYFAYSMLGGKKKETKEAKTEGGEKGEPAAEGEGGGEENGAKLGVFVSLEPFIVNLASEEGKRYLKVAIQLELGKAESAQEVTNRMPQIKDAVITVLSSKSSEELLTIEGKFKLKEQILTRINNLLTSGVVKNVFFVEFVIQ